ncbi:MAG: hypothetical protein L6366_03150 [Candidatus Omnitrophica bacterium]|nr:hypothetical protein [Candidatus Omnitrophota bacterium]
MKPTYIAMASDNLVEQLKTLTQKILNYPQLVMVLEAVGLGKKAANPLELDKLVRRIIKHTDVRLRSAEVFEVIYEDKDPRMAQRLVNTLVKSFISYNIQKKEELALTGVKFAETQAEIYQKKLEETENALYEYRKKNPFQMPGKELDINVSLLINYQTSLTGTELELQRNEEELKKTEDQLKGRDPVILNNDELLRANPIIDSLNNDLRGTQLQVYSLLQSDPGSTKIPDLELRIDETRRRIIEESEKVIGSQTLQTDPLFFRSIEQKYKDIKNKNEALKKQRIQLKKLVDDYESRIERLPEQDRDYARLSRDSKVTSNIYEMLRLKVEENRLDAVEVQQKGMRYEIIEEGRLPLKPSKPQKLIIALVSLILGILSGLGCVFLVEFSDHSFRNIEDAHRFLDVPVIGSTVKMITREEAVSLRRKQRRAMILATLVLLVFIIIAAISSYLQDKKLTERIIREQLEGQI